MAIAMNPLCVNTQPLIVRSVARYNMASFDSEKVTEIHRDLHHRLPSESALRVKSLETLLVHESNSRSAMYCRRVK